MTKTFVDRAAQGDLYIRRVAAIPAGLKLAEAKGGVYVAAHSETGHNHVLEARPNVPPQRTWPADAGWGALAKPRRGGLFIASVTLMVFRQAP